VIKYIVAVLDKGWLLHQKCACLPVITDTVVWSRVEP